MEALRLERVRSFNRTVTERIGALEGEYLDRGRPLGASRLLWEIDEAGVDVRTIRRRLGLDSGYTSRLLRGLEREGLIAVEPDPDDQRVRMIRLTAAGRAEKAELDRLSDSLAASLLVPLGDGRAQRLVDAMDTVTNLLTAGMVEISIEDPTNDAARFCIDAYFAELDLRFDAGFDPSVSISADADELTPPNGLLLVARLRGEPIACGALKLHTPYPAELKRMWVSPEARGLGLGRRILDELEEAARVRGADVVRLETNESLIEAIALYRSSGYEEVEPFNEEPYAQHWFEKRIDPDLRPR